MPNVKIIDAAGKVRELTLAPDLRLLRVGRDPTCEVMLADRSVSRVHAEIELGEQLITVVDRSSNGIFLQGMRLPQRAEVVYGEKLQIGRLHVIVDGVARAQPAVAPAAPVPPAAARAAAPPKADKRPSRGRPGRREPSAEELELLALKGELHERLLQRLDLRRINFQQIRDQELRDRSAHILKELMDELAERIPAGVDRQEMFTDILNEALGLGPLEYFLEDAAVSEIMVVDRDHIYVERKGRIELTGRSFSSDDAVLAVIERIVNPIGRRIDESSPLVDARLKDGSRVNAVIPPLALKGPCITIRKFSKVPLTIDDLVRFGSLSAGVAKFLDCIVRGRKNIVISGGTGSGKTTLLNVLSSFIPAEERIVTIEDAAELQLSQEHVVSLEAKPPNLEGKGEISIRDLVKNALRMRPDRIVVGECRGGEALDMLQAMNTGHDGSMTTGHANNPRDILSRLETMVLMSGMELPVRAIRDQIAAAVDVIIQQARLADGSRRVTHVTEVLEVDEEGRIRTEDVFVFRQHGVGPDGKVSGELMPTGYLPSFVDELRRRGVEVGTDLFKV
jgi:pilus assembly protein CpaF